MHLDVIIPTRNRSRLLARAIESLLAAPAPPGLHVRILVVNNGSTDATPALLEWMTARHRGRIEVINERRRGKSRALNAGISAATGDLIGMIDDDEEIDSQWYVEIYRAFQNPQLDFIGGPYVPRWASEPPAWLPQDYMAVVGGVDTTSEPRDFGPDFPGILKGGNAVVRREVLLRVGPYAEHLGPSGFARLLSCEDEEMYHRLLKAGARGRYLPSLIIHHHVCASRLTPAYFRRWCFWRGVSRGLMDRSHPMPVKYLAGVPRFLFGRAAQGLLNLTARALGSNRAKDLADELRVWDLTGYLWGRHIYTLARYAPLKSRRNPSAALPQSIDASALSGEDEHWKQSCYLASRYDSEGGAGHDHQACRFCVVEHRRASAPTV
jgi:glucosyl-dolichyl phosphate glucuronosyltransferase